MCVCLRVCLIVCKEQQMNCSIRCINVFSKGPQGQRQKGERERERKENERNKAGEQKIHWGRFFLCVWPKNRPPVALKGGIILSSKRTFGYSWPAERLGGLKEDAVRTGLDIKEDARSTGLGLESATAENTGVSEGRDGAGGDQLSGVWTGLSMTQRWGPPKCYSEECCGLVRAPVPDACVPVKFSESNLS